MNVPEGLLAYLTIRRNSMEDKALNVPLFCARDLKGHPLELDICVEFMKALPALSRIRMNRSRIKTAISVNEQRVRKI